MTPSELREAIEELSHLDRLILFEQLSSSMESWPAANTREYRSVLFPSRRNTVHTEAVKDVQAWLLRNRYITLHHAKVNNLVSASLDSATWKRCYIQPLLASVEGLSEHAKKYRPTGHRGAGQKVYTIAGYTPGFLTAHDFPISLTEDPEKAAKYFIELILSRPDVTKRGYPNRERLVTKLQGATVNGTRAFSDVSLESVRTWLDDSVKPGVENKQGDPRYARYAIHNGKVTVRGLPAKNPKEEE